MTKKNIKKLDALWSAHVKAEAGYKCELCGKNANECQLHGHHFIGRRNRATRWFLPNGIALCASHHTLSIWSAHENPEWFRSQMLDIRGMKWLKELITQSNKIFKGTMKEVLEHYAGKKDY